MIDLAADFRLDKASEYLNGIKKHKAPNLIEDNLFFTEITGTKLKNLKL